MDSINMVLDDEITDDFDANFDDLLADDIDIDEKNSDIKKTDGSLVDDAVLDDVAMIREGVREILYTQRSRLTLAEYLIAAQVMNIIESRKRKHLLGADSVKQISVHETDEHGTVMLEVLNQEEYDAL